MINTHNGIKSKNIKPIDIQDYPAIKAHLDKYWNKISKRDDKGITPYNLRNCVYMEDFLKQKIVWPDIMPINKKKEAFPCFTIVEKGIYVVNTVYFLTSDKLEKILYILNSDYAAWYYLNNMQSLGKSGFRMFKQYVENIPIPNTININKEEDVYAAFGFNHEEVSYIKTVVAKRKNEIVSRAE